MSATNNPPPHKEEWRERFRREFPSETTHHFGWGIQDSAELKLLSFIEKELTTVREEERERFEAFRYLLKRMGKVPLEVRSEGKTLLGRIVGMIYMLDYVSLYLAVLGGIDPTPTRYIDSFKRILKRRLNYLERFLDTAA